ncbi:hypothetical protein [Paenibacillus kandeliae]|uniref:hypothetical protein n=1 Tax=Paenibacillus kandeliae TaxID=3231269 RepID=UPI0034597564
MNGIKIADSTAAISGGRILKSNADWQLFADRAFFVVRIKIGTTARAARRQPSWHYAAVYD